MVCVVTRIFNFSSRLNKLTADLNISPGYPNRVSIPPVRFWKVATVVDILWTIPDS